MPCARSTCIAGWWQWARRCCISTDGTVTLFSVMWPALFAFASVAYLLLCIPSALAAYRRWPSLSTQVYLLIGTDIAFVVALVLASGGVRDGLAVLLIAPLAGASMLGSATHGNAVRGRGQPEPAGVRKAGATCAMPTDRPPGCRPAFSAALFLPDRADRQHPRPPGPHQRGAGRGPQVGTG